MIERCVTRDKGHRSASAAHDRGGRCAPKAFPSGAIAALYSLLRRLSRPLRGHMVCPRFPRRNALPYPADDENMQRASHSMATGHSTVNYITLTTDFGSSPGV